MAGTAAAMSRRAATILLSTRFRILSIPISPLISTVKTSNPRFVCSSSVSARTAEPTEAAALFGETVKEFKKRLRIEEVKGGPDEGLSWVGKGLTVRGWVRTCRVQSSVTFIEVNDGSCLSNMQCVMTSDAEGYDRIDSGAVTTGTSVLIDGTVVPSQGAKQKIELKVTRLVVIGRSDPTTYPIQKKRAT